MWDEDGSIGDTIIVRVLPTNGDDEVLVAVYPECAPKPHPINGKESRVRSRGLKPDTCLQIIGAHTGVWYSPRLGMGHHLTLP